MYRQKLTDKAGLFSNHQYTNLQKALYFIVLYLLLSSLVIVLVSLFVQCRTR